MQPLAQSTDVGDQLPMFVYGLIATTISLGGALQLLEACSGTVFFPG